MAIYEYIIPAIIDQVLDHEINCPHCNNKMELLNYRKKRKPKEINLTVCKCISGCLNEFYEPGDIKEYFFVAHSPSDAPAIREYIISKILNK